MKWVIKLSYYDVAFEPRRAIKAQVLANFLAESTIPAEEGVLHLQP